MKRLLASALILIAAAVPAAAAEPAGVRDAANNIVAYEMRPDTGMRDKAFLAFFTPRFRAAIVEHMAGPELNVIDSDFLCQCQTGVAKMRILAIAGSPDAAAVRIASWSVGSSPPVTTIWHFARDRYSWQIADVEAVRRPSLLADLQRNNRRRRR
jgi:hypothetical protein